jgi:hypothetical protein
VGIIPGEERSMARGRARYRFINEAPNWRYWELIFDLEPAVERQLQLADFDLIWEGFNSGSLDTMARQYEEVRNELLKPLMELEPERRRELVRQEPFRDPVLAELLLVESEMSEGRPSALEEIARTAEWIADELPPSPGVHEIRARALTFQAVARHRLGDPEGAERYFGAALSALAALVSALRIAGDLLRQHGLREAGSCDKALELVLSTPATADEIARRFAQHTKAAKGTSRRAPFLRQTEQTR